MKSLNVYLFFAGRCKEALTFYKECLGGEVTPMQTFGEGPMEVDESQKAKIMHAEFHGDDIFFMASDGMGDEEKIDGNSITLSLNLDDETEQEDVFKKLSEGGKVIMELQDTFWDARFGMLTDKFGIRWMLNCDKK